MRLIQCLRSLAGILAIFLASVSLSSLAATGQVPQRKNIDLLTPQELAAYEHAIQIMMDRSDKNPYDKEGYLWQAWVHNCFLIWQPANGVGSPGSHSSACDRIANRPGASFVKGRPGMCEHGKDLFLAWHRAQFYFFEKILQGTDPDGTVEDSRGMTGPSTRTVAVPYWNWTRASSGERYPRRLEDPESPLYHENRRRGPLTDPEKEILTEVTNPYAVAALVHEADWPQFGGFAQEAPVGGFGRFESEHHNPMHGTYFGGDMANPLKAALDPGFFSFHAYIDLIFQFWLDAHDADQVTSKEHFLRATQPTSITPPPGFSQSTGLPSMGRSKLYMSLDTLGYGYEVTAADRLPTAIQVAARLSTDDGAPLRFGISPESRFARLSGDGIYDPTSGPPTFVTEISISPQTHDVATFAVFSRPHSALDLSYVMDLYLHPASVEFDITNREQRQKYIVTAASYWGSGETAAHVEHGPHKPLFTDLTLNLNDIADNGQGDEPWTLMAVISGPPLTAAFGALSLTH